jgi:hypothetical protein
MTAPRKKEYVAAIPQVPRPKSARANANDVRKIPIVYRRRCDTAE